MTSVYLFLIALALVVIQVLIGGTRLIFAFPSYLLLGGAALFSLTSLRRKEAPASGLAVGVTILLAVYVMVRAWFSPYPYLAWPNLTMAAACLVLYLLCALYITKPTHRLILIVALGVAALLHLWAGTMQHVLTSNFHPLGLQRGEISRRASGLLISGNHFAGYLESVAMLALGFAFWGRFRGILRVFCFCFALLCLAGVAISGSRGGYLSVAASVVVFSGLVIWIAAIGQNRRIWPLLLGSVAILTMVAAAVIPLALQNELIRKRTTANIFNDIRVSNWQATIDQFYEAPVFGTGAGTHLFYGRLFRKAPLQADPVHAHGDYLEMLAEYGAVGLGLALLFLGVHVVGGLRNAHAITVMRRRKIAGPPRSNALAIQIGSLGAVSALMAHSVVDFNMHIPGNALMFAMLFGFLANGGQRRPELPGLLAPVALPRLLLPMTGLALILFIAPKIHGEWIGEQARVALRDRQNLTAVRLGNEAVAAIPQSHHNWFHLGEAHRQMGFTLPVAHLREHHLNAAIAAYQNGLRQFPEDEHILVRLGQTLDELGRYDEAEQAYLAAIHWDPLLGAIYRYYSLHLERRNEKEGAALAKALNHQLSRFGSYTEEKAAMDEFISKRKKVE